MFRSRPLALLLALSFAIAAVGCSRPSVAVSGGDLSAAESDPAPHAAPVAGQETTTDAPKDGETPPFQFPEDAGGLLLAKVLPPVDVPGPLNDPNPAPRHATPAPGLESPTLSLPLPPSQAPPPPVPGERTRKTPAPRLVIEEVLGLGRGDPEPPQPRSFFVGDRTRLPSIDVNEPISLPILAQPTADRAPLDDPTVEASTAASRAWGSVVSGRRWRPPCRNGSNPPLIPA